MMNKLCIWIVRQVLTWTGVIAFSVVTLGYLIVDAIMTALRASETD